MRLREILEWSAQLAGCDSVPADSQVYLEAHDDVRRVLFGVDIGLGELLYAREAGFDAVIAHHPVGDRAQIDFSRVVWRQVDQMTAEGIPRDVAEAYVWLASEAASFVHGAVLSVDGGLVLGT